MRLKLAKAEAGIAFERLFARFPEVQLALPTSEIRWTERIGMRAVRNSPIVRSRAGHENHLCVA